jgi:hypothetical protein
MTVEPRKILEFDFRPALADETTSAPYLFENWKTGQIAVLDADYNFMSSFNVGFPTGYSCSVNPMENCFSVINKEQFLCVMDFEGREKYRAPGNYACAVYNGDELWAFEHASHKKLIWRIFDRDFKLAAALEVEDPMYDSHVHLIKIPNSTDMVMELAAGQDGSGIYILSKNGKTLSVKEMFPHECLSRPDFNRNATRFLTLEFYEGILYHYTYPALQKLGEFNYHKQAEQEGIEISDYGESMYIDENKAVIQYEHRFFSFDLSNMTVSEEILIKDHEPKPTNYFYPRLAEDKSLMTDIRYMKAAGGKVFAQLDFENKNSILVFDKADFIDFVYKR